MEFKPPSFVHFLEFVKDKLIVQRSILFSKDQTEKSLSLWKPVNNYHLIYGMHQSKPGHVTYINVICWLRVGPYSEKL